MWVIWGKTPVYWCGNDTLLKWPQDACVWTGTLRAECRRCTCGTWTMVLPVSYWSRRLATVPTRSRDVGTASTLLKFRYYIVLWCFANNGWLWCLLCVTWWHRVVFCVHWVTLTFDLAFRWANVRSKYRLKSKSKVISLSDSLRPKFRSKNILRPKLSRTNWLKDDRQRFLQKVSKKQFPTVYYNANACG